MNDLVLALRSMERSRDFWQQAHQRLCDELARVKAELEQAKTDLQALRLPFQGVDHKEVITTSGYAIE